MYFCIPWRNGSECPSCKKKTIMSYKIAPEGGNECLECGKEFYGRKDKQFCSLGCKNKWHNRVIQERRHMRMEIVAVLTKNYEVLDALLKDQRMSAELPELEKAGFNPAFVTGHRKGWYRHDEYACFDIWYYRSATRIFNVRRKVSD